MKETTQGILGRLVDFLGNISLVITVLCIFASAFLVAINVILRYVFNSPWVFVEEYTGYMVIIATFLALAYTLKKGSHVKVEVVVNRLPAKVRSYFDIATTILSLAITGVLLKYALALALSSFKHHSFSQTVMLTPLWIPQILVAVGLFFFGLELARQLASKIMELR
jgi:TRAP-type C4-dicarboxylate transport system permease small subunit